MGHYKGPYSNFDSEFHDEGYRAKGKKACRVCDDFTSWVKDKNSSQKVPMKNISGSGYFAVTTAIYPQRLFRRELFVIGQS